MKLPREGERGGGGNDKLTVKRCEILGLPGIVSNLRLSEQSLDIFHLFLNKDVCELIQN